MEAKEWTRVKEFGAQSWIHATKAVTVRHLRAIHNQTTGEKVKAGRFNVYKSKSAKRSEDVSRTPDNKRIGDFASLRDALAFGSAA